MDKSVEIMRENMKLDDQIIKLRRCKLEMESMFEELDNLERNFSDNDDSYSSDYNKYSKKRLSKSLNYYKEDSYVYEQDNDSCSCSCDSEEDVDEDLSKNSIQPEKQEKPPYRPARMTFSYKIPPNYGPVSFSNTGFDLNKLMESAKQFNMKSNSMSLNLNEPQIESKKSNFMPRPPTSLNKPVNKKIKNTTTINIRPQWTPNGKFRNSTQDLYASTSFTDTAKSRRSSSMDRSANKVLNPSLAKAWKHTGKIRAGSAVFLSSQDLTKSTDSLKSEKKKKFDPKDIASGWKVVGKSKLDNKVYTDPMASQSKPAKEKEKPKKKILVDEKDVGGGWKPAGKINEDIKIYTAPKIETVDEPSDLVDKKNKFVDPKDVGKGWKAVGKIKGDELLSVYKNTQNNQPTKAENAIAQKPPISKEKGKGWKPAGVSTKPPLNRMATITKKIQPQKDTSGKSKPSLSKSNNSAKSKDNMMTSTPNMSRDFGSNADLNESIIEKKPEENASKSSKKNSISKDASSTQADSSKNKKEDSIKKDDSLSKLAKKEDSIKVENQKKEDSIKKEEPKDLNTKIANDDVDIDDDEEEIIDDGNNNDQVKEFDLKNVKPRSESEAIGKDSDESEVKDEEPIDENKNKDVFKRVNSMDEEDFFFSKKPVQKHDTIDEGEAESSNPNLSSKSKNSEDAKKNEKEEKPKVEEKKDDNKEAKKDNNEVDADDDDDDDNGGNQLWNRKDDDDDDDEE